MADFLPAHQFVRVHKSYVVALSKVTAVEGNTVYVGSYAIQFNRNNKEEILGWLLRDNYLKR